MSLILNTLVGFIAISHIGFMILEMFFWAKPVGQKIFRTEAGFAKQSAPLAANQGLYNGFLAAGLIWSLLNSNDEFSFMLKVFFLSCVFVAGIYGAATASKNILYVQALPAAVALVVLYLSA